MYVFNLLSFDGLHTTGNKIECKMNDTPFPFRSVLFVDDDPLLQVVMETYFAQRGAGYIEIAGNGFEALECVKNQKDGFDFILSDLNMPEMDGIQFLRELTEHGFDGQLAILSGEENSLVSLAHDLAIAHQLNIVGFLNKPLKLDQLDDLINATVETKNTVSKKVNRKEDLSFEDLEYGLQNGEIVAFYQPKICATTGKVTSVEALARWNSSKHGFVGPEEFIPIAEKSDLISDVTQVIIENAIREAVKWKELNVDLKTAVNLSMLVATDICFPDKVVAMVKEAGLSCSDFTFEVTESKLLKENAGAMETLARLRMKGFGLSIDDFGTGFSNIDQLRNFPFNELKIDQTFIRQALHDPKAKASVELSVEFGRKLAMNVVAEGIETKEELEYISQLGVNEIQGFYFAQPMPFEKLVEWFFIYQEKTADQALRRAV